jgi:hypothetical protein
MIIRRRSRNRYRKEFKAFLLARDGGDGGKENLGRKS